ncbi:MAG: O-antigen ligase family protein [Candidatus Sericytochromatia bacterium]|nr:O-antigen ligase family protein [Candidatus Sericytochromatia bacterium]
MADTLARWLDRLTYLTLPLWVLGTIFWMPRFLDDPFKIGAETFAVAMAWVVAAVGLGAETLRGGTPGAAAWGLWPWRVAAAFVVWVALSTLWAPHPALHARFALTVLAYVFAAQAVWDWIKHAPRERVGYTVGVIAALVSIESVLGLMQQAKYPFVEVFRGKVPVGGVLEGAVLALGAPSGVATPMGSLGNQNYLAELLALCVPVVLGFAISARQRFWQGVGVLVALVGFVVMVACGTRAAALGLSVGAVVSLVYFGGFREGFTRVREAGPKLWALLAVVAVGTLFTAAKLGGAFFDKVHRLVAGNDGNILSRLGNWDVGVKMLWERPLQGHGLGGWKVDSVVHMLKQHPEGLSINLAGARFHQMHSDPLQLFVELGFIGGGLMVLGMALWAHRLRGDASWTLPQKIGLVCGMVALTVSSAFGFPFHVAQTALAAVVVVAVGLVCLTPSATGPAPSPLPLGARLPVGLAVFGLVAGLGFLSFQRGMGPVSAASEYHYLAEHVQKEGQRAAGIEVLFGAAVRHDPFKPQHVFGQMGVLAKKGDYAGAVKVYEAHANEGLGSDSMLIYGKSLSELGRTEEAKKVLHEVLLSYPPEMRNHALAARYLAAIGGTNPRQAEFDAWVKSQAGQPAQP